MEFLVFILFILFYFMAGGFTYKLLDEIANVPDEFLIGGSVFWFVGLPILLGNLLGAKLSKKMRGY